MSLIFKKIVNTPICVGFSGYPVLSFCYTNLLICIELTIINLFLAVGFPPMINIFQEIE